MRRFALLFLALMFTTSACFGTSGSWRCANGTPCAFTPGIGYHCPGVKPAAGPRSTGGQRAAGSCSHCRTQPTALAKGTSASSPCGSVCPGCRCEFRVISSHVPGTTAQIHSIATFDVTDFPIAVPSEISPTVGFAVRHIIFTTGPPNSLFSTPRLTTPARAPPRLPFA